MKTLLILGGSHAEIPLIQAAKRLDYFVITTGNNINDIGHGYADQYVKADFSNKEEVLELAIGLNVDAICPCANDFAAISCSYVAEKLGLGNFDSYETSMIIHHKDNYRVFTKQNKILSPFAENFTTVDSAIKFFKKFKLPVIIKPVDLSGGKGVSKVDALNVSDVKLLIENAFNTSKAKRIVIEEFIEGTNHGFSAILKNGKIIFNFCDNEHYFINKYLVSGASTTSSISEEIIERLIKESEKIASILNLKDGIFHVQFILSSNIPYIIEICRRPPGDLYVDLVKYAIGIDYPKLILQAFVSRYDNSLVIPSYSQKFITRHCIMSHKNGVIKKIKINTGIEDKILDKHLWYNQGDLITDFMTYKAGIIFLKYDSEDELYRYQGVINDLVSVEFSEV